MTSHPRAHRPAATDYFDPTEQIELLQSIKAKIEKSATSTPQEYHFHPPGQGETKNPSTNHAGAKSIDFKAHELSLREKLEKAKADREAKAKAEAASKVNIVTDSPLPRLTDNHSTEPVPAGPPPPPILNNTSTPVPPIPYSQSWTPNMGYSTAIPNYGRPPFPYTQPYPQQYGMPPYPNGQLFQPYPQWGQSAPPPNNTPGVPPPPPQPNQGPPNQIPTSQNYPNQVPLKEISPPNQTPPVAADTRFRVPPFGPTTSGTSQPVQQPAIPPRPPQPQATQAQQQPLMVAQPAAPAPPANSGNQNAPTSQPATQISPVLTAPKGPAGSMLYNSTTPVSRGQAKPPATPDTDAPNGSEPPRPNSPRGRPLTPRHQDFPHRYSQSPSYFRGPPQSDSRSYSPHARYSPEQQREPRPIIASRIETPPSRVSYRDRSRSPHQPYDRPQRPIIPDEGYRRENWDPNRGGYKINSSPPPSRGTVPNERRFSPLSRRSVSPPPPTLRYPRREVDDGYFRDVPPVARGYPEGYPPRRSLPSPSMIRPRSRSPPYSRGIYHSPPPPPSRDYSVPRRGGYYDYPSPRDPYPPREGPTYPPHHRPPPPAAFRDRREYDDYYPSPQPMDYPDREYERGYPRRPSIPPPEMYDAGYREYLESREWENFGPPPPARPYSPPSLPFPQQPPRSRGKSRGSRRRGRY